MQRIEPYAVGDTTRLNDHSVQRSNSSRNISVPTENATKASLGRLSISQNSDPVGKETKSVERSSVSQSPDPIDDSKSLACMPFFNFIVISYLNFVMYLRRLHPLGIFLFFRVN